VTHIVGCVRVSYYISGNVPSTASQIIFAKTGFWGPIGGKHYMLYANQIILSMNKSDDGKNFAARTIVSILLLLLV